MKSIQGYGLPGISFALFLSIACGEPGGTIRGRVLVDACPQLQFSTHANPACVALAREENCAQFSDVRFTPAPSASLRLQPGARSAATNTEGAFSFENVAVGRHALSVNVTNTVEGRVIAPVEIPAKSTQPQTMFQRDLTFSAAGRLEGFVLPPTGAPPEDLVVQETLEGVAVQLQCSPRTATTNAQGYFFFDNVQQGRHSLSATGLGLLGTSGEFTVFRGRSTKAELPLLYGFISEEPVNRSPLMLGDIELQLLRGPQEGAQPVLPPVEQGFVRGQVLEVRCRAQDPDGDPVRIVWAASSGALATGGGDTALLTLGNEDVGLSCTAADGRGGSSRQNVVVSVYKPYFAGATLLHDNSNDIILSSAYGSDFDIVLYNGGNVPARVSVPEHQWLPKAQGVALVYVQRDKTRDSLLFVEGAGNTPQVMYASPRGQPIMAHEFVLNEGALIFVDRSSVPAQIVHVALNDAGAKTVIGTVGKEDGDLEARVAGSGKRFMVLRQGDGFELYDNATLAPIMIFEATGRMGNTPFATNGTDVVYFGPGPLLATARASSSPLSGDAVLPLATTSGFSGRRIIFDGNTVAFSAFEGPTRFDEITVVRIASAGTVPRLLATRAVRGAAQVLDMHGRLLLYGRPGMLETEPGAELWLLNLNDLPGFEAL